MYHMIENMNIHKDRAFEYLSVSYMWCKETHTDISFNLDICEKGSYFILRYNRGSCARYWLGTGIHTFTCTHAHTHTHTQTVRTIQPCVSKSIFIIRLQRYSLRLVSLCRAGDQKKNVFFVFFAKYLWKLAMPSIVSMSLYFLLFFKQK